MITYTLKSILATTALAFISAGAVNAQEITGAGASFPAPLYSKWAADYNKATGVKVNYQSVGSGAGIKQIDSKTVDFGASDMPQTDEVLKTKGQFQFPTVIGGTVPVINVKGIAPGQMKLDGQILGDIYLGKITKWNDAAIKALNPGLALPDADIAPLAPPLTSPITSAVSTPSGKPRLVKVQLSTGQWVRVARAMKVWPRL
jgi:phosphate transport system substrate-binding protein